MKRVRPKSSRVGAIWIIPPLLLGLLPACHSEPEAALEVSTETERSSATAVPSLPRPPPESASHDQPPPRMPSEAQTNYFDQARARADQQLQQQTEHCLRIEAQLQDDCITSATTHHEAAIAAARVEYEAQLAEASADEAQ